MDRKERDELALEFARIAAEAGELIISIRGSGTDVGAKPDGSPVTAADVEAEQFIRARVTAIMPQVSIIAEESFESTPWRSAPERFLLIDPLDGTREFLSGSDEFTVNIALIENGEPVVGAICAPALNHLYLAGATAYQVQLQTGACPDLTTSRPIGASPVPGAGIRAVGSRSHMDPKTKQWLSQFPAAELRAAGSSLKFCLIARGDADVYPRMAPTMEWDTAAGHAILNAAGGCVTSLDGAPLRYGKTDAGFKNEGFIAWGRKSPH